MLKCYTALHCDTRVNSCITHLLAMAFVAVVANLNYISGCQVDAILYIPKDPAHITKHFTGFQALINICVYPQSAL